MNSYMTIFPASSALFCLGVGIFVFTRNKKHPANIGFALGMFSLFLIEGGNALSFFSETETWTIFWKRMTILGSALLPPTWFLFSLTFARANYREVLSRWKPALLGTSLLSLLFLPWIGSEKMISLVPETGEIYPFFFLGSIGHYFYIYLLLGMVLNLIHLENTLRSSNSLDRWHIKYILFGVGGILAFQIYLASQVLLFSQLDPRYVAATSAVILIAGSLMLFSMVRYRLLSVDVFISRYVIYNSLTILLTGVYLLAVGLAAQAIQWLGGSWDFFWSILFSFIAILFLIIVFFSTEFRRKVQLFINRHFYRHKYEFRDKWMETTERIGAASSVETLQKTLVSMVQETLGAKKVALYLFDSDQRQYTLAESASASGAVSRIQEDHPFIHQVEKTRVPFFLEKDEKEKQQGQETIFPDAVLCTPLVANGEIVGFLLQGEDFSNIPYGTDDFEILKAISTQAANQIKNIRLSSELLIAKEAEAFNQVSTFFIHDLKNFVSTLSLLVQNAGEHIHNPSFQRDALKTLTTTVSKMNALISRLTLLSKRLDIRLEPVLLNELLDQTLSSLNGHATTSRFEKILAPLPPVLADREQLQKVILNLLLNAIEASPTNGMITLQTYRKGGEIILSVSDHGCGMPGEFIHSFLFKPFRSTKPQGLGVGLFQSKKIMEAHGGRIEVESIEGKGSTFRVALKC